MKRQSRHRYVVLQEYIPTSAQKAIKRAVKAALPRVYAPQAFVTRLGQDLVTEARRRHVNNPNHVLRTYGLVGGSALSVAGGFLIWLLLKKQREDTPKSANLATPSKQPVSIGQV